MFISPAYAQAAGGGGSDLLIQLMPLVLIFAVFWFFLIRPQQQKMKQHRELVAGLKRGDQVVTGGGLIGRVSRVLDDNTVQVDIAEGVRVKVMRQTNTDVLSRGEPAKSDGGKRAEKAEPEAEGDEAKAIAPPAATVPPAATDKPASGEKKSLFSFGSKR